MSLVIRVSLVGIFNSLLVEENTSLGICVPLVGQHISLGICVFWVGEYISLGVCASLLGQDISLGICVSLRGKHYITSETHTTRKMCFPRFTR